MTNNLQGLLHAPPLCDHVFNHQHLFAGSDFKISAQFQLTGGIFFRKNMPQPEGPANFMPDKKPTQGRRDDRLRTGRLKFVSQRATKRFGVPRILQNQGTLKKLATVQSGPEQKMPFQ